MMNVGDWMSRSLVSTSPDTKVEEALALAMRSGVSHLPVLDADDLVGIVCVCDLEVAKSEQWIADVMHRTVVTISPAAPIEQADLSMTEHKVGCLVVVEDDCPVGIVTHMDLRQAGLGSAEDYWRCVCCGSYHHVRPDPHSGIPLCLSCSERSHAYRAGMAIGELEETGLAD